MSLYEASVPQLKKMLTSVDGWLEKAAAHAATKSFDPNTLLQARLAPDAFPLVRQIQSACDTAKQVTARLAGKPVPSHPDTEQTVVELRERIRVTLQFIDSLKVADFADASDRRVALPFLPGKVILGKDYLNEMALPNFYFHVVTAYQILRHNGLDLGKRDFLGSLKLQDA